MPFIAAYKILQNEKSEKTEEILFNIVRRISVQASGMIKTLLKIPGLYKKIPKIANVLVTKTFSEGAGFLYSKTECTKTAWKADIVKCPYFETCKKLGCPEIAHYFCDSDDIIYGNMHEKILWKRTKTLGRGDEVCDFCIEVEE